MKFNKYLILIITMLIVVSCEKTVTGSDEYTLIGKWSFSSATFERILTTNSHQTAKIPYSGEGRIVVAGGINQVLSRLFYNCNAPQTLYAINVEHDLFVYDVLTIDIDSKTGTLISPLIEKTYTGQIDFTFDGETLVITNSVLTNQDDTTDIINVEGELSFETVNISANSATPIALPAVISTYPQRYMQYEFNDDGTFKQTINSNEGIITRLGTWESDGDIVTITITENDYTEVHTIDYVIENNILTGTEEYDLCQSNDACLASYENAYQIDEGSLENIKMTSSIVFRAVTDI